MLLRLIAARQAKEAGMPQHIIQVAMRSLSTRLIAAFAIAIVATSVVAGVPAYQLVHIQLEQQALARVADGGRVTQTLLKGEQVRLANLVELTTQRPTLQRLLQESDTDALSRYLRAFQADTELEMLVVHDTSGQLLAGDTPSPFWPGPPVTIGSDFHSLPGTDPGLALLASQPVYDNQAGELLGYVTAGILLDDDFTRRLAAETGVNQSIVLDGVRTATSLADASSAVESDIVRRSSESGQTEVLELRLGSARYYATLLPIRDANDEVVALSEVALSVDGLVSAERRALITLILSTILVASTTSVLGALYARQLTAPLRKLTAAASRISHGDLITPVPTPKEPTEIATLAAALEESRVNTRRTLDELSQAKVWSETLIQSIVEGVVTFNSQGLITFFSQGAERITGWSSEKALGRPLDHVFHLADCDQGQFSQHIPPCRGKRQMRVLTRSGRPATLAVTGAHPIRPNSDGVQTALVLRDITEEEASQHLRSYFLANVSHEFRTPLSAINASVELLLEEAAHLPLSEMGELLNSIHLSVVSLQTLIDNLLESTSIEAGRFNIRRCLTGLEEIIDEATRVMQPLLNRRRQHLSIARPARLPVIYADPTRLTQVLVNLLSNASKYSPMGEEIDLILELVGDDLRVAIADRGPGIPSVERDTLFRRFVRLDTNDGTQYGIGLGLSVVKTIVQEHGGRVGVDERPGGGSVFWATLPLTGGDR